MHSIPRDTTPSLPFTNGSHLQHVLCHFTLQQDFLQRYYDTYFLPNNLIRMVWPENYYKSVIKQLRSVTCDFY
jgi:hypothetical protein